MPVYERLDSTTLRGSGRGRWRRHVVTGMTAVMAAGVIGSGVANAAPTVHKTPAKPPQSRTAQPQDR
jgi:hypothetical protein